jgi:hypothetical protein
MDDSPTISFQFLKIIRERAIIFVILLFVFHSSGLGDLVGKCQILT